MSLDRIRQQRADQESRAATRAAELPNGDYYADGKDCVDRISGIRVTCESHWDACLVMLAVGNRG